MKVSPTNSSNPGDLTLRIDSDEERRVLATVFPGLGKEKFIYWSDYPVRTSLLYDAILHRSDSSNIEKVWTFEVGWDEYESAVDGTVKAEYEDRNDWEIEVTMHGSVYGPDQNFRMHRTQFRQNRRDPSVRSAVTRALREVLKDTIRQHKDASNQVAVSIGFDRRLGRYSVAASAASVDDVVWYVTDYLKSDAHVTETADGRGVQISGPKLELAYLADEVEREYPAWSFEKLGPKTIEGRPK